MGVIITSYRTIIFSLVCATLVSMLFFVAGYMLGKRSVVDPNARIAMIFPAESSFAQEGEITEEKEGEETQSQTEQVAANKTKSEESVNKGAITGLKDKQREKENGKKTISKAQPTQPAAKEKKAAKSQSKAQQHNAQKIEQPKKTDKEKVVKLEKQQKTPQAADKTAKPAGHQGVDLTTQTEKPAGARYSIQIEAFGVQRNANRFLDKIKQKYPSAYIFENAKKKRLPLAVRVGYFVSYRKALEAAKVFQAREKRAAMVVKINQ